MIIEWMVWWVGWSVVGVLNKAHFELDSEKIIDHLVLQIGTKVITNGDRLTYYELRQNPITNCDS